MRSPRVIAMILLSCCLVFADAGARKPAKTNKPVEYPATARQMHLSGTVKLDLLIAASGKVKRVDIVGGHPVLAAAAADTVKDWTYEAASSDTTQTVIIKFEQQ